MRKIKDGISIDIVEGSREDDFYCSACSESNNTMLFIIEESEEPLDAHVVDMICLGCVDQPIPVLLENEKKKYVPYLREFTAYDWASLVTAINEQAVEILTRGAVDPQERRKS